MFYRFPAPKYIAMLFGRQIVKANLSCILFKQMLSQSIALEDFKLVRLIRVFAFAILSIVCCRFLFHIILSYEG